MPDQVRKLTWKQVRDIFFHARGDHGELEIEYSEEVPDDLEQMRRRWRDDGLNDREIELKLAEWNEVMYAEQVCREKGFDDKETARQVALFRKKLIQQRIGKGMSIRS